MYTKRKDGDILVRVENNPTCLNMERAENLLLDYKTTWNNMKLSDIKPGGVYNVTLSGSHICNILVIGTLFRSKFMTPTLKKYKQYQNDCHSDYSIMAVKLEEGNPVSSVLTFNVFMINNIREEQDVNVPKSHDFTAIHAPHLHERCMNYYLLNGLVAWGRERAKKGLSPSNLIRLEKLEEELDSLEDKLEKFWAEYLFVCCLVESRWAHNALGKKEDGSRIEFKSTSRLVSDMIVTGPIDRNLAWIGIFEKRDRINKEDKIKAVEELCRLFSLQWHKSYGGKNWLNCSKLLRTYLTGNINRTVFIDSAIALAHNSNSVIDKLYNGNREAVGFLMSIFWAKRRTTTIRKLLAEYTESTWCKMLCKDFGVFVPKLRYQEFLKALGGRDK